MLGPGGGLILGPGCALGHTTPPDNIRALIETAWKHGVYNPDGTRCAPCKAGDAEGFI